MSGTVAASPSQRRRPASADLAHNFCEDQTVDGAPEQRRRQATDTAVVAQQHADVGTHDFGESSVNDSGRPTAVLAHCAP